MKNFLLTILVFTMTMPLLAADVTVSGPDGNLKARIFVQDGYPMYSVTYKDRTMLTDSPLGFISNTGDYSQGMTMGEATHTSVSDTYELKTTKVSRISYTHQVATIPFTNAKGQKMELVFRMGNNDIAFKYKIPQEGETACCIIEKEATGFRFPEKTTTFLTPQATPMIGWKRTKPSYEEEYIPDDKLGAPSRYGVGYTFPGLFHIGDDGWVLVSETGVTSAYCASKLSEPAANGLYTVAFPEKGENNGIGSEFAAIPLPGETPWRTLTVSDNLKPVVETTIPFDVVEELYEPSMDYKYGRATWSWIMWQDNSMNYDDQIIFMDLAAEMGYEYILVDALWDKQVGYDRMPALFQYAQSKGVDIFLWYNSNGYWNDAPQGMKQRMHNSIARKKEMKWLKSLGVKGLKVDFFGGDKQETMKLYEDILSDANDHGLMIIFHGCTLPRGWEKMYPNFVGSEAVLASENLIFNQHFNDNEAYNACLHPFIRNAVGSMDFGPVLLNKRYNRTNDGGTIRKTTDIFQLATAIVFQNPIQNFAITPNNLTELPAFEIDFMKEVPTTWDETVFIDGYPGRYCILARRHGDTWYIAGINANKEPMKIKVNLPMLAGKTVTMYTDNKKREAQKQTVKIKDNGETELTIQPEGGTVLVTSDK